MVRPIPESWGTVLREFNKCHNPKGENGGQFCSDPSSASLPAGPDATRVGITSFRQPHEPGPGDKQYRQAYRRVDEFVARLGAIPTVSHVRATRARGQWGADEVKADGTVERKREPSWAVSYVGNGEARRLLAQYGKDFNQDAVLIMKVPRPGEEGNDILTEFYLPKVSLEDRADLTTFMTEVLGLKGWTWIRQPGGSQVLRVASVEAWREHDLDRHKELMRSLRAYLKRTELGIQSRQRPIMTEVIGDRSGGQTYDEVLGGV